MDIQSLVEKSRSGDPLAREELIWLLNLPSDCPESYLMMAEANRVSKELTTNKAEVHAQLALNLAP